MIVIKAGTAHNKSYRVTCSHCHSELQLEAREFTVSVDRFKDVSSFGVPCCVCKHTATWIDQNELCKFEVAPGTAPGD